MATFSARAVAIRRSLFQVSNFLSRVECASHVTAIFTPAWNWKIPLLLLLTRQSTFRRERVRPAMYESAERSKFNIGRQVTNFRDCPVYLRHSTYFHFCFYRSSVWVLMDKNPVLSSLGHFRRSEHHFLKD